MKNKEFKYDVAISFLTQDEYIAKNIIKELNDKYKKFIYTEKQNEIVGTDGFETFSNIFEAECRLAIILFRKGWGENGMTLIEKTGLQNRYMKDGYSSILFVLLNDSDSEFIPKWYPKNYLWLGFEKYGIKTLISAIENKLNELGGGYYPITSADLAKQFRNKYELGAYKKHILKDLNTEGPEKAIIEVKKLFNILINKFHEFNDNSQFKIGYSDKDPDRLFAEIMNLKLSIQWYQRAINHLEDSSLNIIIYHGFLNANPKILFETTDYFDVMQIDLFGWKTCLNKKYLIETSVYANLIFQKYNEILMKLIK